MTCHTSTPRDQPTPCPICDFPVILVNEPNRKVISCHNCGWLKNLITGRQLPGDPRLTLDPPANV